ncbi:hypothetical protein Hdeb2414_s0006g00200791 [Helianthus debilis subsp. tardiflorus]
MNEKDKKIAAKYFCAFSYDFFLEFDPLKGSLSHAADAELCKHQHRLCRC